MKTCGLLGGSFDPVHLGHLRSALEMHEALGFERIHFVPCAQPAHRAAPRVSGEQRLVLLELAVAGQPAFVCDDRELRRASGPSYMYDTLLSFRGQYRDRPLCLLLGLDAFVGFSRWHRWAEICDLAHLVIARRPGADLPERGDEYALYKTRGAETVSALHQHAAGSVLITTVTQLEISATDIRARLAAGRSIRYLVPDAVADYIETQRFYVPRWAPDLSD
mgnify:FL=1